MGIAYAPPIYGLKSLDPNFDCLRVARPMSGKVRPLNSTPASSCYLRGVVGKAKKSASVVATFPLCGEGRLRNSSMQTELTKEIIEQAFDEMGALAAARGITIEIAVYGGSCLILASDIRNASGDVDAVFLAGGKAVREIADAVAARLDLPPDWINEGVKRMAPPPGDPQPNLILAGEYPRVPNSIVGLRVHLPTPAYMLAMKILANRVVEDTEKNESDLERFPKRLTRGFPWGREHDSRCLLGGGQQAWRSRIRRICVGEWLGRSRAGPPSRKLRSNGASASALSFASSSFTGRRAASSRPNSAATKISRWRRMRIW